MTVAPVGNTGDAIQPFRGTNHSPSYFAPNRAGAAGGSGQNIVDFCVPCNPYFPTPGMFDELAYQLRDILTYYPSSAETITAELAFLLGLQPQTMAMGNGSTELITWIDHLLVRDSLAVPIPAFGRWTDQPMETGKRVDMFLLPEAKGFALDPMAFVEFVRARGSRTAVICNPNNPDGGLLPREAVISILDGLAHLDLIVVDESFLDFADADPWPSVVDQAVLRPNVIVLRSLGKNFGLHGVRFGYMVANPGLVGKVRSTLPKWNLNSFAEVIVFMLKNHLQDYAMSLRMVARDRQEMISSLACLPGMTVFPSQGNFVFAKLPDGANGAQVRDRLLAERGVLVRECGNKLGSSSQFMRLVVRPEPDVQRLLTGLSSVLYGSSWYAPLPGAQDQLSAAYGGSSQYGMQQQPLMARQPRELAAPAQEYFALYAGAFDQAPRDASELYPVPASQATQPPPQSPQYASSVLAAPGLAAQNTSSIYSSGSYSTMAAQTAAAYAAAPQNSAPVAYSQPQAQQEAQPQQNQQIQPQQQAPQQQEIPQQLTQQMPQIPQQIPQQLTQQAPALNTADTAPIPVIQADDPAPAYPQPQPPRQYAVDQTMVDMAPVAMTDIAPPPPAETQTGTTEESTYPNLRAAILQLPAGREDEAPTTQGSGGGGPRPARYLQT